MKIIKVVVLLSILVGLDTVGFCLALTDTSTIDFGMVNYLPLSSGFNQITISDDGRITTGGLGHIISQTSGLFGKMEFGFSTKEQSFGKMSVEVIKTGKYILDTEGCGQITISNIHITNGATSMSNLSVSGPTMSFPVGATLTLNTFKSYSSCYIQGTIDSAIRGTSIVNIEGDHPEVNIVEVPLIIKVNIVPSMEISHVSSSSLNFGTICYAHRQQTITIFPNGTVSSDTVCPTEGTNTDSFLITGNSGQSFSVNIPSNISISNGTTAMDVELIPFCSSNCLLSTEEYTLKVGGTLKIPDSASVGKYSGDYQLTITYLCGL